ncbi:uncharacterized protein LOC110855309 isoform X2 [Folsomia candida]|uniref:uncharacterized protein LOC110855309 isoform X2 n=1 Tax=Folsomia candida TaxID=158441 RepID=UPI001604EDC2|nr:uncharacterized protein LOC110855309 isoform X2 [Folsomia candida]
MQFQPFIPKYHIGAEYKDFEKLELTNQAKVVADKAPPVIIFPDNQSRPHFVQNTVSLMDTGSVVPPQPPQQDKPNYHVTILPTYISTMNSATLVPYADTNCAPLQNSGNSGNFILHGGPIPSPSTFSSPAQPFGKEAVIFKCYHCPENFNDMNLRRAHWIARHSNVFRRIEGKYYHTCSFPGCNRDNMLTSRFMAHFRRSHLKKKRKILTPRRIAPQTDSNTNCIATLSAPCDDTLVPHDATAVDHTDNWNCNTVPEHVEEEEVQIIKLEDFDLPENDPLRCDIPPQTERGNGDLSPPKPKSSKNFGSFDHSEQPQVGKPKPIECLRVSSEIKLIPTKKPNQLKSYRRPWPS